MLQGNARRLKCLFLESLRAGLEASCRAVLITPREVQAHLEICEHDLFRNPWMSSTQCMSESWAAVHYAHSDPSRFLES